MFQCLSNVKLTEIFVKLPSCIPFIQRKMINPTLTFPIFKILPQDLGSRDPNVLWTLIVMMLPITPKPPITGIPTPSR